MVSLMKLLEGTLLGGIHPVDSYTDANMLLLLIVTMDVSPLLCLVLLSRVLVPKDLLMLLRDARQHKGRGATGCDCLQESDHTTLEK